MFIFQRTPGFYAGLYTQNSDGQRSQSAASASESQYQNIRFYKDEHFEPSFKDDLPSRPRYLLIATPVPMEKILKRIF
jgi:hypothetical protein